MAPLPIQSLSSSVLFLFLTPVAFAALLLNAVCDLLLELFQLRGELLVNQQEEGTLGALPAQLGPEQIHEGGRYGGHQDLVVAQLILELVSQTLAELLGTADLGQGNALDLAQAPWAAAS